MIVLPTEWEGNHFGAEWLSILVLFQGVYNALDWSGQKRLFYQRIVRHFEETMII